MQTLINYVSSLLNNQIAAEIVEITTPAPSPSETQSPALDSSTTVWSGYFSNFSKSSKND